MIRYKQVLSGERRWSFDCAECFEWLRSMEDNSVDLIFTSPPYESARLYLEGGKNVGIAKSTEDWVSWLTKIWVECDRVCKGLVAFVIEGQTRKYQWSAGPALLMAALHSAGLKLRKPPAFKRVGIPGSGGPDWLRNDYEFVVCTAKGKLPWSDNTAMGHPPKYGPGGEMSYRGKDGSRKNSADSPKKRKPIFRHSEDKSSPSDHDRLLGLKLANPGNVIGCIVGGGAMGHPLAHENEAPFPESLCDFFVKSFCPPQGVAVDPFAGSGSLIASAFKNNRRGIGCDLRQSQVSVATRRLIDVESSFLGES